jgi:hypothetical protein
VRLVEAVAQRGPHTHGWASPAHITSHSFTGWHITGGPGPLDPDTAPVGLTLGHSRLATSGALPGDAPPDAEYQPLTNHDIALAHNGTLPEHDQDHIDSCWLLTLRTVHAHAYIRDHPGRHALITIDLATRTLRATTTGQPLWLRHDPDGTVLTSVPVWPGTWQRVPDRLTYRSDL